MGTKIVGATGSAVERSTSEPLPWVGLALALALAGTGAALSSCGPRSGGCVGDGAKISAGCPATFDGTMAGLPPCSPDGLPRIAWRCGALIALSFSGGYTGTNCYYDSASRQLVGAEVFSDISDFCGGTSFTELAGRTAPDSCDATIDRVERDCSVERPADAGGA